MHSNTNANPAFNAGGGLRGHIMYHRGKNTADRSPMPQLSTTGLKGHILYHGNKNTADKIPMLQPPTTGLKGHIWYHMLNDNADKSPVLQPPTTGLRGHTCIIVARTLQTKAQCYNTMLQAVTIYLVVE